MGDDEELPEVLPVDFESSVDEDWDDEADDFDVLDLEITFITCSPICWAHQKSEIN